MIESVAWKYFEKTGNIDFYLLYADMKNFNIEDRTKNYNNKALNEESGVIKG